jgi:hypothetical protein
MRQNFFNFILMTFGLLAVKSMKLWIKYHRIIIKNKIRIRFIRTCINKNITPPHLNYIANHELEFFHFRSVHKFNYLNNQFILRILKTELNDAFRAVNHFQTQIFHLRKQISRHVPNNICESFFAKQTYTFQTQLQHEHNRLDNKLKWLMLRSRKRLLDNITPVQYCYSYKKQDGSSEMTLAVGVEPSFSLRPTNDMSSEYESKVLISPRDFADKIISSSLYDVRDGWFINLSSNVIPTEVQTLLQLGENFSLPLLDKRRAILSCIKNLENNLAKIDPKLHLDTRNFTIPVINNLLSLPQQNNEVNNRLKFLLKATNNFIQSNPDIIFTKADKGNITVALNGTVYKEKMLQLLQDQNTYSKVKKDPTSKMTKSVRELLTRWRNKSYITPAMYKRAYCSDGNLPRAYGLPKVHKPGCPFRIIISSIDSPMYALATFLHGILSKNIPDASSNVANSFDLIKKLKNINIETDFTLISLDVVSLFTNIPVESALESVSNRWEHIEKACNIPKHEFLLAVQLVLNSTFFCFDNNYYKQNFGTPMGSPLSPIIADFVMQDLESKALNKIGVALPFYFRYVDDIVMAVPNNLTDFILLTFNSFHPRLQFTIEIGGDIINFLDITIIKKNNGLEFDWYHKPTFSGRYLNFLSAHPLSQKRGTIMGMVDRAFLLSDPHFHKKNIELIIGILLNNDYPVQLIFETINSRLKSLIYKQTLKQTDSDRIDDKEKTPWFVLPYVPDISDKFASITKNLNVRLAFFSLNKLGRIIRVQKDALPSNLKKNVVYKIVCKDCDASYVGQTGRRLKTRTAEHRNNINRINTPQSVITEHRINCNHEFDWEGIKILDSERYLGRRLVSEMLHIRMQSNSLNLQSDTECLHHAYLSLLKKL